MARIAGSECADTQTSPSKYSSQSDDPHDRMIIRGGPRKRGHKLMAIVLSDLKRYTVFPGWKIPR